jgi:hypothetical protein
LGKFFIGKVKKILVTDALHSAVEFSLQGGDYLIGLDSPDKLH